MWDNVCKFERTKLDNTYIEDNNVRQCDTSDLLTMLSNEIEYFVC